MSRIITTTVFCLGFLLAAAGAGETERKWRTPEGRYWRGTLVDANKESVILTDSDGDRFRLSLEKLRVEDQRYVANWLKQRELVAKLGPEQVAEEAKLAAHLDEESRAWTSQDGRKISGKLMGYDGEKVKIRTSQRTYEFAATVLSERDQRLLAAWKDNRPIQVGKWPEYVVAKGLDIEELAGEGSSRFVYRSEHFEFRANSRLSKSVVKDFAGVFEATFEAVKALPIGLDPRPSRGGYYVTELYDSRDSYYGAGGPPGSGGVYMSGANKIMIPLPNLGVKRVGNRWIVEPREDNGTLKHEITHQVTHNWLASMPVWMVEGIAEYFEAARFNSGRYSFKNMSGRIEDAIMAYPVSGNSFPMIALNELMTMGHSEWSSALTMGNRAAYNYRSACALVYYFLHLDGTGDGAPMAAYLHAINQGVESKKAVAEHLMRGRDFDELERDVHAKLRKDGIRVD